jgi:hypothetical protein
MNWQYCIYTQQVSEVFDTPAPTIIVITTAATVASATTTTIIMLMTTMDDDDDNNNNSNENYFLNICSLAIKIFPLCTF